MLKTKRIVSVCVAATLLAACASQRPAPVVDRSAATKPAPAGELPAPMREAKDGIYTVQRGDTLYSIALAFGIDPRDLARWNGIADPALLKVGQPLRVIAPAEPVVATVTPVTPGGATEVRPLPPAGAASPAPIPPLVPPAAPPVVTAPPAAVAPATPPPVVAAVPAKP
jgi:lipoprotein NlpD